MRFFQHFHPAIGHQIQMDHDWQQQLDNNSTILSLLAPSLKRKQWPACQQMAKRFRVACDCRGFSPESVKVELSDDGKKLVLTGLEKTGDDEQFTLNQFRRKFDVPANADTSKMKSFMTAAGQFIVDMPLRIVEDEKEEDDDEQRSDWLVPFPKLVMDKETGVKEARMSITLPRELDTSKVRVTVKDHDVIVQAKDEGDESHHRGLSMSYMRRSTMPAQCDMQELKCLLDTKRGNRLLLSAPLKKEEQPSAVEDAHGWKSIPIEMSTTNSSTTAVDAAPIETTASKSAPSEAA